MSDHEDILMGLDAISDRLNDALSLVGATRETYLNIAQQNFSLQTRIKLLREMCTSSERNYEVFASDVLQVLDGA